jgi:hypothetical protein
MPAADKEALTIEPWAAGLGIALVVLVMGVALFATWDRAHTGDVEAVITPTAVGDMHFATEPAGKAGATGLKYEGRMLDMAGESKMEDAHLIREGADDSGVFGIYRMETEGKGRIFVKVGVNKFMEVTQE